MATPYGVGNVQRDELGRSYFLQSDGSRYYVSPPAMDPNAPKPKGSFIHNADSWNSKTGKYDKGGVNWGNLLSMGVGGLLAAPAIAGLAGMGGVTAPVATTTGGGVQPARPRSSCLPLASSWL